MKIVLDEAFGVIDRAAHVLELPAHVREEACHLFRRSVTKELIKGRRIKEIAAACLYAASKRSNSPTKMEQIARALSIGKKAIARDYRLLLLELGLSIPLPDSSPHLERIAKKLGLSRDVQLKAVQVLEIAHAASATLGKDPSGLAAAALYIASRELGAGITQKELAVVANVTEVTVRNRYLALERVMNQKGSEVPDLSQDGAGTNSNAS